MVDLFYFSKKQDALKHLFHNNISHSTLILFSALPDLSSVYNDHINILHETPISKSKINYISNEVLNNHNYLAPLIYLNIINKIYWVIPEWAKNNEIKDIYWQDGKNKNFKFLDEDIPSHKHKKYSACESKNFNTLFSPSKDLFASSSFKDGDLLIDINKSNNNKHIPIYKIYLDELSGLKMNQEYTVLIGFDYYISSGYNMFGTELPVPIDHDIDKSITNTINTLIELKDNLKMICLAQNPNYTPDDFIIPIGKSIIDKLVQNNLSENPILGPFYYSDKIILDIINLLEILKINFSNDPRNFGINDYKYYINLFNKLNLTYLEEKLINFVNTQNDPAQPKESLKSSFDILTYEIQNFIRNSSINKAQIEKSDVMNEFSRLKERDEKLVNKTFKEINEHIKNLEKLFE